MLNFHDRKTGLAARIGIAAAGVAMTLFPSSAMSQDPEPMVFCAYQPELDDLVGVYTVTAGPSALSSGGMTIPNANIETYQSTFAVIDGVLVMFTDGAPSVDFHHIGSDEPDWIGADNVGGIPVTSTEDISILLDCDINSLVRIIGTGIGTAQDGRQFEFTIRLFASLDGLLVGGNLWTIDGMTMRQRLVYSAVGN